MKCIVFLLLFVPLFFTVAQDTTAVSAQETIESVLSNSTDEQDVQQLGEELEYLYEHPINIAKPNYNDLLRLPFISPMLAEAIIIYTDTVPLLLTEQLMNIPLMTRAVYDQLLPFITIENIGKFSALNILALQNVEARTRVERRLQISRGYFDDTFKGDINSTYQRMRLGNEHIELAGLFEKDAGEIYDDGLIKGYLSINNISVFDRLVIGDFTITSGQGLVFAKNIATTKASNAVGQIKKRGGAISPNVSTEEYRYFRGAGTKITLNNLSIFGFYSQRKLPASIDSAGMVTGFYTSGLFRTLNDQQKMNVLDEKVIGSQLSYAIDPINSISFSIMNTDYTKPISSAIFDLRSSRSVQAGSVTWELSFQKINLFGEIASNEVIRFSKIFGLILPVSPRFSVSFHHREFTKGFVSPFARPFGERDIISDGEIGNYIGAEFRLKDATINAYVDNYYLPASSTVFGARGRDLLLHGLYPISKDVELTLQVRNKTKTQTISQTSTDQRIQTNYRAAYVLRVSRTISLTQRFEFVDVQYEPFEYREKGFLTFIEGTFKQPTLGLHIKTRLVFFDTDSYDSRLYQYESDVTGNFSNPPMYDKGIRWYFILGYEMMKNFKLSMKYSETKRLFEHVIGNGDDEIAGNLDNSITLQLDFEM